MGSTVTIYLDLMAKETPGKGGVGGRGRRGPAGAMASLASPSNIKKGKKKGKKVDVAITLGSKNPVILIECKKSTEKLNDSHYRQLREYCTDTNTAKIGILTNGIVYKFYTRNNTSTLQISPFF